jgi:hypothetical protein
VEKKALCSRLSIAVRMQKRHIRESLGDDN